MSIGSHMHIEVKKDGKWFHFASPDIPRDSAFFDLVSGVCLRLKPVADPRGLPGDMSEITRFCHDQDRQHNRLHHRGWLDSGELAELQRRLDEHYGGSGKDPREYDLEHGYLRTSIDGGTIADHRGWDDARLVFWFDN